VETEEFRISFFKPTTQQAKMNRNLIIKLFIAWAVAIFGFQILLKIIEKPVPEEALVRFIPAWEKVAAGTATDHDLRTIGQSIVQVTGKLNLEPGEYAILKDGISWTLAELLPEHELAGLQEEVRRLNRLREEIVSLQDPEYLAVKESIISIASPTLGIGEGTLEAQLLAIGLVENMAIMEDQSWERIPEIMHLYMTHNRSVLTDTIFLGFPFHYFYTAVFLLLFFIGLCWLYCYRTDKLHARLNFLETTDD
jgi:putative solute:sodium symporter small subunit